MVANVPLLVQAWGNVHRLAGGVLELLSIPTALAPGRPPRPGAPTPRAECDETSPRVTGPHTALELGCVCPSEMRTLDP